ncbi:MAG: type II toxin-antitoxin system HicB family antitoxin [Candidatus Omnitrophota bacterium]|jgi:predicted HicB family RNase H-like nuclease|nr:MAG: type II toxin-antitoxin system HicB family antitoxin [Candidatus Omnitrophota bacterium]
MNVMKYKGYSAWLEYDADARLFHGRVLTTRDMIAFEGQSVDELEEMFHSALEDYFDLCKEEGKIPAEPIMGEFSPKITPEQLAEEILKNRDAITVNEVQELLQVCDYDPGEDGSEWKFWTQWHTLKKGKEMLSKQASSF